MTQTIRVFGVCLLLLGFTIAGCGDDGDGSATNGGATAGAEAEDTPQGESNEGGSGEELEPTSESKAEYVADANALCKARKQEIQAEVRKIVKNLTDSGAEGVGVGRLVDNAIVPGLEAEVEELRELGAPQGEEAQIEEILSAIDAAIAEAGNDPDAFSATGGALGEAQQLAREYGIDQCGKAV